MSNLISPKMLSRIAATGTIGKDQDSGFAFSPLPQNKTK